jgi:threonine synthase
MNYLSTRGKADRRGFQAAVMSGLAEDGGLMLPESLPDLSERLEELSALSYQELAIEIMKPFVDLPDEDLAQLVHASYDSFRHEEVVPTVKVGDVHVLELFHGPTLAFKDVALQFLGNLFAYFLERSGAELNIVAATSGDTGSAAIQGVRGRDNIRIFVMYPDGRTSHTQELQMTSVLDDNVHNLAVDGTFDDCQGILKELMGDVAYKHSMHLGVVNSINWARVLAQIVYFFHAALRVRREEGAERVRFAVPTGNFGDIFAGYMAVRMGAPIGKLVLATNENNILARFFNTGVYESGDVVPTLSPSMDIQIASNFERYLYYLEGESPERVRALMAQFQQEGRLHVENYDDIAREGLFVAGEGDTAATLATIREYHERYGYLLDPHTAVGVYVGTQHQSAEEPMICLATAHPAKFSDAITQATGQDLAHHPLLDALEGASTRKTHVAASASAVRDIVTGRIEA